jgi:hypothetical protein
MPYMDGQSLFTAFILLAGTGLFLRMVAKEKRRREKHLEYRLFVKTQAAAEEQRQAEFAKQQAPVVIATAPPGTGQADQV